MLARQVQTNHKPPKSSNSHAIAMTPPIEWLKERWKTIGKDSVRFKRWARQSGPFYCGSAFAHILAVVIILSWSMGKAQPVVERFDEVDTEIKEPPPPMFILGTPPVRPSELSARSVALAEAPSQSQKHLDDSPVFEDAGGGTTQSSDEPDFGGLGGFIADQDGDKPSRTNPKNGVGVGLGTSIRSGSGGSAEGFNGLGSGNRTAADGADAEEETERAVAAALNWLRRHQHEDGSWSLTGYACHCHSETCYGACDTQDDILATSLGLLAFLAAGQSNSSDGPYQQSLARSVDWLLAQQSSEGGFVPNSKSEMHTHHIATLALSECYGMTGDARLADAAQRAIDFSGRSWMIGINEWRCAMISRAQRYGLTVDPELAQSAADWLAAHTAKPDTEIALASSPLLASLSMSATDIPVDDAILPSLLTELFPPTQNSSSESTMGEALDCFLTNGNAPTLDRRRSLIASQAKAGCLTGSWYFEQPQNIWATPQGRFPTTCFTTILLAASYRHLPMHRSQWTVPVASQPDQPISELTNTKR
jgi:hypothetical protein